MSSTDNAVPLAGCCSWKQGLMKLCSRYRQVVLALIVGCGIIVFTVDGSLPNTTPSNSGYFVQ